MLLPPTCPICGATGPAPCPSCAAGLARAPGLPPPPGIDRCRALLAYDANGRLLVSRLKYRNARSSLPWLAAALATLAPPTAEIDVVTWVPTTKPRRRVRGFDQAELLARRVAGERRWPCRPLLARDPGPPQTGRSRAERQAGPRVAPRRPAPPRVLLVDDVITTGSTVTAAARALRSAGARHVTVIAAARTPLTRSRSLPLR